MSDVNLAEIQSSNISGIFLLNTIRNVPIGLSISQADNVTILYPNDVMIGVSPNLILKYSIISISCLDIIQQKSRRNIFLI